MRLLLISRTSRLLMLPICSGILRSTTGDGAGVQMPGKQGSMKEL